MCQRLPIFCWATKWAAAAAVWYGDRLLPNWYLHILPLMVRKFWPKKLTITSFLQPTSAIAIPSKPTMAPTRNAAFSTSISSVALRLATSGLNSESRTTVSIFRPITPPAALTSSTAICVAVSISWASSAIGPVIGTTTPTLIACWPRARRLTKGKPETALTAPAPARVLSIVRRVVGFIVDVLRSEARDVTLTRLPYNTRATTASTPGPRGAVVGSALEIGLAQGPALRPHPRPHHPRSGGDVLQRHARGGRARRGARLRLDLALRSLPHPGPGRVRGRRGDRGPRGSARPRGGAPLDAAARVLDRALRARARHHPPPPRHQRAVPFLSVARGAGQDGGDPRRDQRGAARPGPGRRVVRAGVPRLRHPVSPHRRADRPARGGRRDHPAHVDGSASALPGPPLRDRPRGVRSTPAPAAASADLDPPRSRSAAPARLARGRRRQRALVGPRPDPGARPVSRRGVPRGRARSGRARALGHRAADRGPRGGGGRPAPGAP